jgi:3-oxoacyl-[acyl-carrier-protein] synthase-3
MRGTWAAIRAIASYLPPGELGNDQLAAELGEWNAEKILNKTGIAIRHIAAADECASDMGVRASQHLFEMADCKSSDIDFLLFCTQTPDYLLPATACMMQHRLGLRTDCGAVDFNQGCSGYVYGLAMAKGLVETGAAKNVLLVTADTYTKLINPRDRSVRTLFGDGATATLVGAVESDRELIGPFVFGTDGRGAQDLIVPAGGMRFPLDADSMVERKDEQGNWRSACNLYMNGAAIFKFTQQTVPRALHQLLEKARLSLDSVDYFIFHQANKFMLDRLRVKMKIPEEKFFNDMRFTGNTVSSTIPIALEAAFKQKLIKSEQRIGLIGFGVGLSWAAAMVEVT